MEHIRIIMNIFVKNKKYSFEEISDICEKNDLMTVDCLKDENMISVEAWNNGDMGDCIWEFDQIKENLFKLKYVDKHELQTFLEDHKQK